MSTAAGSPSDAAATVVDVAQQTAVEAANQGTVGLYYIREHVQQALPAVLQASTQLQQAAEAAGDASYGANHSREFAATLRGAMPGSLQRMEASLRDASWSASEVARRHKEKQGGGSGLLSSLLTPPRLLGLWPGGSSSTPQSGSDGMYG